MPFQGGRPGPRDQELRAASSGSASPSNAASGSGAAAATAADAGASVPDEARIWLQFTSPTKPALITGSTGRARGTGNGDEPAPDYRYLVVPLRALASA